MSSSSPSTLAGVIANDPQGLPGMAGDDAADAAIRRSQHEAQRLQQALKLPHTGETLGTPIISGHPSQGPVRWLEPQRPSPMPMPPRDLAASESPILDPPTPPLEVAPPAPAPPRVTGPGDRQTILDQLRRSLHQGDESALRRAVMAAGLSLADPFRKPDDDDVEGLTPAQRDLVHRYHQLIVQLGLQLSGKEGSIERGEVEKLLEGLLPSSTLRINNLQLCRRVQSFGVYDPFPGTTFLAGRSHKAIVYVELDNFHSRSVGSGDQTIHQVKLQQDIAILNHTDGLEVWKAPTARIVDESRQKRRDFFVVQMIEIPANLGVGKYQLRVRMTDTQAQTTDEAILPLSIVADPNLTRRSTP